MIGLLRGVLLEKQPPLLLLDVGGVGYEVHAPLSTFENLPGLGETVQLCTHMQVREDGFSLFGFASTSERALFRSLIKVTGIGAKTALTMLSGMSVDGFIRCIRAGEIATLVKIPGVGRKTAERLIVELRDHLGHLPAGQSSTVTGGAGVGRSALDEAQSALISLGYKLAEANHLLADLETEGRSSEDVLRMALRRAMR